MVTEPLVFFNYRRSDSGQRAERLCDALRYAFGATTARPAAAPTSAASR